MTFQPVPADLRKTYAANAGRKNILEMEPEKIEIFCGYLRAGMFVTEASALIGTNKESIRRWLKRGADDIEAGEETIFAYFVVKVNEALAQAELNSVTAIRSAGDIPAFWMAHAWYLERRYPDRYGKQDRLNLQHSGATGSATVDLTAALSSETGREKLADVASILSRISAGSNQSTSPSDSDDKGEDSITQAFGLSEQNPTGFS